MKKEMMTCQKLCYGCYLEAHGLRVMRIISLVLINLIVGLNVMRYLQKMKFFRARMTYSSRDTLWSTGNLWTLLIETGILLIQPYPFLHGTFCP